MVSFPSRIFSSSSDMPTFQTIAILSYFWWLVSTFRIRIKVSPGHSFYNSFSCFHTYVSRSVIVFNIELNELQAISILFKISSSHFPFDVIVCPK